MTPFPLDELLLIDSTVRMFTEPVLVGDTSALAAIWEQEARDRAAILAELQVAKKDLNSADKFAALLRQEGEEPQTKEGKNGPIYAFAATDDYMRGLLEHDAPRVRALAEARLAAKSNIVQTRSERLGWMSTRGAMCVYLAYCAAHTTRWGGGDALNWQNFPRASALGEAVQAPPGHVVVVADASQIECVAEGQLVTTRNRGLVPIERIVVDDFVWDGVEWVSHEGLIYKGERHVITYEGLTATPDHVIYPDSHQGGITLEAASKAGRTIRTIGSPYALRQASMRSAIVSWLQNLWRAWDKVQFSERRRGRFVDFGKLAARVLRRSGNRPDRQRRALRAGEFAAIYEGSQCEQLLGYAVGLGARGADVGAGFYAGLPGCVQSGSNSGVGRPGSNRGADSRARQKFQVGYDVAKEDAKARSVQKVYDLLNAGPRHRFMVSGVVVSNCRLLNVLAGQHDKVEEFRQKLDPYVAVASRFCGFPVTKQDHPELRQAGKVVELQSGFGSGGPKIAATLRKNGVPCTDEQGMDWRDAYRNTHKAVVNLWYEADEVLKKLHAGLSFSWKCVDIRDKRIYLPNGLPLIYDTLEMHEGEWRLKTRRGYVKMYGAKLVENLIQALSATHTRGAWLACAQAGMKMVSMMHDSLVAVVPEEQGGEALKYMIAALSKEPDWLPGIPLDAEGFVSRSMSKKDEVKL